MSRRRTKTDPEATECEPMKARCVRKKRPEKQAIKNVYVGIIEDNITVSDRFKRAESCDKAAMYFLEEELAAMKLT